MSDQDFSEEEPTKPETPVPMLDLVSGPVKQRSSTRQRERRPTTPFPFSPGRLILAVGLLCLASCVRLPHIPPEPRMWSLGILTTAMIETSCSEPYPFTSGDPADPHALDPDVEWRTPQRASGVVISERHILTAAHVVGCPIIPAVEATYTNKDGMQHMQMAVTQDDIMFGKGRDIAKLEIASADHFHIDIAPPLLFSVAEPLKAPHGELCAFPGVEFRPQAVCGYADGYDPTLVDMMKTQPGDSGAPVYDELGRLVGLVVAGGTLRGDPVTKMVLLSPEWLEGT